MARIGHKKSRGGCRTCKKRKVKCDEQRPCSACVRLQIECSFASKNISIGATSRRRGADLGLFSERKLEATPVTPQFGGSIHHWNRQSRSPSQGQSAAQPEPSQQLRWTTEDLYLMNHYTSVTSGTLPGARTRVWRQDVPEEAKEHMFLMHQILAVTAFHLAVLEQHQCQRYLSQAFQHQHHAIVGINSEVNKITSQNCHALFAASSLLFFGAFAASHHVMSERVNLGVVKSILEVFRLIQGVAGVLESSRDMVRQGILGEFMRCDAVKQGGTELLQRTTEELLRFSSQLDASSVGLQVKDTIDRAIAGMEDSIGKSSTASPELTFAITWPMALEGEYLDLLRRLDPTALVILAHYCVILDAAGSKFWFMQGWGQRIMGAILGSLGPAWHESIKWPMQRVLHS